MFMRRRPLRVIGRNRFELYLSLAVVLIGFCYSAVRPQSFSHAMVSTGSLLFGLVFAFNAVWDHKRMYLVERIFAVTWLLVLVWATSWTVWDTVTAPIFSPR